MFTNCDNQFIFERCKKIRSEVTNSINLPNHEITISMGVASNHKHKLIDELIKKADESLYMSKNAGKNQITFNGETYQNQNKTI